MSVLEAVERTPTSGSGAPAGEAAPVDLEEARLIRRSKEGDMAAFENLYRRFAPRVYGLCLRMAGDAGRAEELTQDVFVRVWEKLHLFRGNRPFAPWLLTLASNLVISDRRSRRRKSDRETQVEEMERMGDRATGEASNAGMDLDRAIRTLPEGARTVFVLHDVEGYRHDEIARQLGLATGTSKAQLHRARRMLREALRS
jgi:RNA polymerase sigma-70 factor (ECF subfamily)